METFTQLYERLIKASLSKRLNEEITNGGISPDPHHLECLLNPGSKPPIIQIGDCLCSPEEKVCEKECLFSAIHREGEVVTVENDRCSGCARCLDLCRSGALSERKELLPILELLNAGEKPVYALIAPAFNGQFTSQVTAGKLRSAFKALGFTGMVEAALFADILTLKEALEFDRTIHEDKDFMLTSCCCPIWIAMIKKVYHDLVPHMPPAVSPMVACGRAIKKIKPGAVTVFIGPCVAKKAEAREPDIKDAVDYVLTFKEIEEVFNLAGLNPAELSEDDRDHSSRAGRIYARTGGVSEAVQTTLERLSPHRTIPVKALQADGIPACKELLKDLTEGRIKANFMEGMGCRGGCVGGPKAIIKADEGTAHVNEYGDSAAYKTPLDNPHVLELLQELGFDTVESLLEEKSFFIRHF